MKIWSDRVVCAGFLTHPRTKPWVFHTQGMSWGVWKIHTFDNCLEKFGCKNHTVKKSFFYVLLNLPKIIFSKVTLGQIFWSNSSPVMLLEYIDWRKNLKWCFMQNVSSVAISVWQLCFKIFFQEFLKTADDAVSDDLALVWNFDDSCFSSTILQRSSLCHKLLPKVSF